MLGSITCVTIGAPDLGAVEAAYCDYLGYRVAQWSKLGRETCEAWGCEKLEDAPCLLLAPEASDDFVFRFVEQPRDPDYVPLTTWGWNAAEIIVRDVDTLAAELADSPYEIIGEPANLSFTDDIRAMQVTGPGGEVLYLTEIKRPVPGLDTPTARSAVDRTFIVILGGRSMEALQDFYHERFGVPRAAVMESRITLASLAFGLPRETRYPIAALALADQSFIEADELPELAGPRKTTDGYLPPGIAMVSFLVHADGAARDRPKGLPLPEWFSGSVSYARGSGGELLELLHTD